MPSLYDGFNTKSTAAATKAGFHRRDAELTEENFAIRIFPTLRLRCLRGGLSETFATSEKTAAGIRLKIRPGSG
jgi:hypothetical protein